MKKFFKLFFLFFSLAFLNIICYNYQHIKLINKVEAMETKAMRFADYGYEKCWKNIEFLEPTVKAIYKTALEYKDDEGFLRRLSFRLEQDNKFDEAKRLKAYYKAMLGIDIDNNNNKKSK